MCRRFPIDRNHQFSIFAHIGGCMVFWIFINVFFRRFPSDFVQRLANLPDLLGNGLAWGFKFDVYGAVVLAAVALTNLERKKKEELRLAEIEKMFITAQLEALKMQLHPHFLFNALNSIVELIHQNANQAAQLLDRLEEFLRITLRIDGVQDVPLRKELAFIDCYLEMQKVRFPKRLSVKMDIDENSMDSRVPILILQPLVENAIRHGIARNPKPGEISIYSKKTEGALQLKIGDTGPGISNSVIQEGIGLANTKRRLQHMYGSQFRFEMRNEASGGLVVSLEIPTQ
jgi:LytS/YehU family sensor histidine kinase